METIILTSHSATELNRKIKSYENEGYIVLGSHQVVVIHSQNRFAGMQHRDTINEIEYSITLQHP